MVLGGVEEMGRGNQTEDGERLSPDIVLSLGYN